MKKEKIKALKKEFEKAHKGTKNAGEVKLEKAKQPNLFGEHDEVYNTIQEEITIVVDEMTGCRDTIEKKEDRYEDLRKRKARLDKAAETVAKLRDAAPKKKAKEEKKGASWPKEKKESG